VSGSGCNSPGLLGVDIQLGGRARMDDGAARGIDGAVSLDEAGADLKPGWSPWPRPRSMPRRQLAGYRSGDRAPLAFIPGRSQIRIPHRDVFVPCGLGAGPKTIRSLQNSRVEEHHRAAKGHTLNHERPKRQLLRGAGSGHPPAERHRHKNKRRCQKPDEEKIEEPFRTRKAPTMRTGKVALNQNRNFEYAA
jgi:hypothetical protein